jgi:flagellar biosynthesis protein FlhB
MGPDQDASSKTEAPTPRKLQRARQQGQVARSRDLVHTACLLAALCATAVGTGWAAQHVLGLFEGLWLALAQPSGPAARALGTQAWQTGLLLCAGALWPLALAGLLADRLQTGPVWSLQRLTPRLQQLDPLAGLRRLASGERWFEVLRSLLKTVAATLIGWVAVKALLGPLSRLPWQGRPQDLAAALWETGWRIAGGTLAVMAVLSVLEWLDQHRRLMKRLRMSRHELRREHREQEGDPHLKSHRRQAQQSRSQEGATQAARQAHVLLVNPTHLAVAIGYDRQTCPVPTVSAKGVDVVALAMREAAEEAGVPIVRNVPLARELHDRADVGDLVPFDLFEVMAEVILWAREVRTGSGLTSPDDGVARSGGVADAAAGR